MAKGPPDFRKFFFDALGGVPAPVRYPLRRGPSLLHDFAFLSSLLHDARVLNLGAAAAGEVLTIRLNRQAAGNRSPAGFIDLETGPPERKRIERVADSFTAFINLLEVS